MSVRVKICGCRTPEQALVAAEAGADFIGLIFAESRRKVTFEEASEIVRALGTPLSEMEQQAPPPAFRTAEAGLRAWFEQGCGALDRLLQRKRPLTVGVFANSDPGAINEAVDECGLDLVQLSGGEPWPACLLVNRQVIKVLHLGAGDKPETALSRVETGSAMAVLLDRADPGSFGGSGQAIDWSIAQRIGETMPFWLAGGLSPDNVVEAIKTAGPWCIDVSSGVETDGEKDPAKIRAFLQTAKGVL